MNSLSVFSRSPDPANPGVLSVFWWVGKHRHGRVEVHLAETMPDARIVAELSVIRHLLLGVSVLGERHSGVGLRVVTSAGAIKKLLRADSAKNHLIPYALFLRTRLLGVTLEVDNKPAWVDAALDESPDVLVVTQAPEECLTLNGFGAVQVRAHLLDRVQEHYGVADKNVWSFLTAAAADALPVTLPARKAIYDAKHKQPGNYALSERYDVLFVVVPAQTNQRHPQLVTAYRPLTPTVPNHADLSPRALTGDGRPNGTGATQ